MSRQRPSPPPRSPRPRKAIRLWRWRSWGRPANSSISRRWTAPSWRRSRLPRARRARPCCSVARPKYSWISMPRAIGASRLFRKNQWRPKAAFRSSWMARSSGRSAQAAAATSNTGRQRRDNPAGDRTMRLDVLIALSLASTLALAGTALGQQPAPSAPPSPAGPPADYGPPITNEQAKAVAAAAFAEAKKNNWRLAFTIVGPAGEIVYFEKMDGTQMASTEISQGKARTAALYRRPTKIFADQFAAGNTGFMTFPTPPIASEGGVPITVNGKIVGAIGASGGTGQQDGVAAAAGAGAAK